jgi:beta-lactam-binding protein with PASTA domain
LYHDLVSLLDGKYEIISQRLVDDTQTLFEATAPDGSAVTVVWYDFATGELEWTFQAYRQTLRALKSRGLAAVLDLVSRPGAHYVAWRRPPPGKPVAPGGCASVLEALRSLGLEPSQADIRLNPEGKPQVYGLAFNENLPTSQPGLPALGPAGPAPVTVRRPLLDRARLAPWALGLVLGVLGLGLFYLSFWLRADNSLVVVPPLLGQQVNAAARELHALGLAVQAEVTPSSSQEAGQVVGLEPVAGTQLRRGRAVTLRYALPPGSLTEEVVPELRGRLLDGGEIVGLLGERLELGEIARIAADVARGTVLAQSPPAGSRVPSGGAVNVLVSDGPREPLTFLPELRGLPVEEALELARLAGLGEERVTLAYLTGAPGAQGTVLDQSLPPFLPVSRDLAVLRLTVAGSPAPRLGESTLPDLWTMSREDAEHAIQEAGFQVGRVQEVQVASLPSGVVVQNPGAGALPGESGGVETGVELTVNIRPVAVTVEPSVEVREPPPCEFPYRFALESGIADGEVVVIAQIRDGNPQRLRRLRAGGGEVVEGLWTITDAGPVTFGLTFNGIPYGEPTTTTCRPATAG